MKFVLPCVKLTNKPFKPSPATHNSSCFRNLQILNTNSHLEQQAQQFSLSSDTFTQYNCVVHTFRKLQSCCIVQVHGSPPPSLQGQNWGECHPGSTVRGGYCNSSGSGGKPVRPSIHYTGPGCGRQGRCRQGRSNQAEGNTTSAIPCWRGPTYQL